MKLLSTQGWNIKVSRKALEMVLWNVIVTSIRISVGKTSSLGNHRVSWDLGSYAEGEDSFAFKCNDD